MRSPGTVRTVLALALLAVSCGKKGPPLPPLRHNPMPVTDVHVGQQGNDLVVTYVVPTSTVDAKKLDTLEAELVARTGTGKAAKKLEEQRVEVKAGERRIDKLPLPAVGTAISITVRTRSHGAWSSASPSLAMHVRTPPEAPANLTAGNDPAGVLLTWPTAAPTPVPTTAPTPQPRPTSPQPRATPALPPAPAVGETGYVVRRRPENGTAADLTVRPIASPPYVDENAEAGRTYCYTVRRVESIEPLVASADSPETCLAVKDVRAPAPPTGVAVLERDGGLEVSWSPSPETDVASYRVYRFDASPAATPEKIADRPMPERSFVDKPPRGTYRYVVTAVDKAGNESAQSAPVEGTIR